MKNIIKDTCKETVLLNSINENSIVGLVSSIGKKFILAHMSEGYVAARFNETNFTGHWGMGTKKEYVEEWFKYVDEGGAYLFETYEELFNWIKS